MKYKKLNKLGFGHIETIILCGVLACLVVVAVYVYRYSHVSPSHLSTEIVGVSGGSEAPTDLSVIASTPSFIELSWTASDNASATYEIERNGSVVGNTDDTAYTDSNVAAGVNYTYTVIAEAGKLTYPSASITANTESASLGTSDPSQSDYAQQDVPAYSNTASDAATVNGTQYVDCPTLNYPNSCTLSKRDTTYFSGYAAVGRVGSVGNGAIGNFTEVSSEIRAPNIGCSKRGDAVFMGIGLNGFDNVKQSTPMTVQLDGMDAICDTNGHKGNEIKYYPIIEMAPADPVNPGPSLTIKADQLIKFEIQYSSDGYYHFSMENVSTNTSAQPFEFKCNAGLSCQRASAQWMVVGLTKHPLLDYGSFLFDNNYSTEGGVKLQVGNFMNGEFDIVNSAKKILVGPNFPLPKGSINFRDTYFN